MSDFQCALIMVVVYKVATLLAGVSLAYMGYKLFRLGIFGESGDPKASWSDASLVLKRAAPGTFFVVLGTIVLVSTVWRGLTAETVNKMIPADREQHQKQLDPDPIDPAPVGLPAHGTGTSEQQTDVDE